MGMMLGILQFGCEIKGFDHIANVVPSVKSGLLLGNDVNIVLLRTALSGITKYQMLL